MLVGLLGKKRSGKDTTADYIVNKYGFNKRAFADPLKNAVKELFMLSNTQLYGDEKDCVDERWELKPREIFQLFGTEIVRNTFPKYFPIRGDSFWVKNMELYYNDKKDTNIVISDVRFQDEIDFIEKNGGVVIKLVRYSDNDVDGHESENIDVLKYKSNILINNDGTIDELYNKIDKILIN